MLRLARTALQRRPHAIPRSTPVAARCALHTHCCTAHAATAAAASDAAVSPPPPASAPAAPAAAAPAARPVRVRYAPSPTGSVHLGGLRTALYNFLFAKKAALAASESGAASTTASAAEPSGKFLLRIEDTDQKRLVPTAVDELCVALKWAGLHNDEGPGAPTEGDCGPYVQSQRLPLYQQHVQRLLASGHAYPCFCSAERLTELRDMQLKKGLPSAYDRLCLSLDDSERDRRLAEAKANGTPYVVRMKVPQTGTTNVFDLIRGQVTFLNKTLDDQVLLKSDGFPTYHLACVVDDHLMRISHVIRGDEWLTSTPKHVLLYRAFGWSVPAFAHLPLLLKPDGTKLSKRHADSSLDYYISRGYLPEALVNFVALLGWNPGSTQEVFSLPELVRAFSLDRIQKAGAVVNLDKLNWFNAQHLQRMANGGRLQEIVDKVKPMIRAHHSAAAAAAAAASSSPSPASPAVLESDLSDDAYLCRVILSLVSHVTHMSDFVSQSVFYYRTPDYASSTDADLRALRNKVYPPAEPAAFELNARLVQATLKQLETLPDSAFEMNAPPPPTAATAASSAAAASAPASSAPATAAAASGPTIQSALKQLIKDHGVKQKTCFLLLRYILSGSESGPSISVIIATLGRDRAMQRLHNAAAYTPPRL